ncbi:hypothetical protein [Salisaeta icosahedral phage 1]|uniref:hypothetical protein n=1 Tax=Salisaeta icosahedral phage 1 TaxID=1183239 RepID=UPI00025EA927|nr:hypothetical protein A322_gp26 [Salisaeta icosahedral phage 1]AFJ21481.1 hypothetical protein [Salisaeta icosahedral phage 1]
MGCVHRRGRFCLTRHSSSPPQCPSSTMILALRFAFYTLSYMVLMLGADHSFVSLLYIHLIAGFVVGKLLYRLHKEMHPASQAAAQPPRTPQASDGGQLQHKRCLRPKDEMDTGVCALTGLIRAGMFDSTPQHFQQRLKDES